MLTTNKVATMKFNIDTQKNIKILGDDLTFRSIREFERIKHVHKVLCKG